MSEVLTPGVAVVTVGNESYPVHKFCLVKSMKMLKLLTAMTDEADLTSVIAVGREVGWLAAITDSLPKIVGAMDARLFNVLAFTLMPNKRVFEIIDAEGDLDAEIKKEAKKLMLREDMTFDKAFEIVKLGYDNMGLESLQGNVKALLDKIVPPEPAETTEAPTESGSDS